MVQSTLCLASANSEQRKIQFHFAINPTGTNKDWDFRKLAANFQDKTGNIYDVRDHVKSGHALCAGLLGGKWRKKDNIIGSQWLLLDIDNSGKDEKGEKIYQHQLTLDEAVQHPFIQQYCALIYTTASHTPEWHKFRLIFLLPEFVEGYEVVEVLTRSLMQQLPHDPACKDASRVFYGSTAATFPLIQPHVTLPSEWVESAKTVALQEKLEYQLRIAAIEARRQEFRSLSDDNNWDVNLLIQQALSYIPPRSIGSGNYEECISVLMALYNYYGAVDAEIIAEQWSPSIKGETWNIRAKIKSFRGSRRAGITIGTLFYIAKQYGFRFPTIERYENPDKRLITREQWEATHGIKQCAEELVQTLIAATNKAQEFVTSKFPGRTSTNKAQEFVTNEFPLSTSTNKTQEFVTNEFPLSTSTNKTQEFVTSKFPLSTSTTGKSITNSQSITVTPGKCPTVEEWISLGRPKIYFQGKDRKAVLRELREKGHTTILDVSPAGTGKSHTTGTLMPDEFGVGQLFYISVDHRNPTVSTLKEWTDLPARNNGLVADENKLTSLGEPHIRWTKDQEKPNIKGNCFRTPWFHAIAKRGYRQEATSEAEYNPVCNSCHLRFNCKGVDAAGNTLKRIHDATYRRDRRNALGDSRIRAHINSLPQAKDINNAGAFVDEVSRQLEPVNFINVTLAEFDHTLMEIQTKSPELYNHIKDIVLPLREFLANKPSKAKYHGYEDKVVRELLGSIPDNLPELITQLRSLLDPKWEEIIEEADSITLADLNKSDIEEFGDDKLRNSNTGEFGERTAHKGDIKGFGNGTPHNKNTEKLGDVTPHKNDIKEFGDRTVHKSDTEKLGDVTPHKNDIKEFGDRTSHNTVKVTSSKGSDRNVVNKKTLKSIRRQFKKQAHNQTLENIANLPKNWLIPLLEVFGGITPGSLRIKNRQLIIGTRNTRPVEVLKAFDFLVMMDATASSKYIALMLGIEPEEILVISEIKPDYSNLTIHQITGFGLLGKDRSDPLKNRVAALRTELNQRHNDNIAHIDHLAEKQEGDGHWFVDNRGTNAYQDKQAIGLWGTPYQDIGALQQIYITLTGDTNVDQDAPGFSEFVDHWVQAEVVQGAARLRANRRSKENLICYVVSEKDLSYLLEYYPGAKWIRSESFEITSQAGKDKQQTKWAILQGFKQLIDAGVKVGQKALAKICGITQGYVSQIAQDYGGWKNLQKLLLLLLEAIYRPSNNFLEELSDEERYLVYDYLPLLQADDQEYQSHADENPAQMVVKDVLDILKGFGEESFRRALAYLPVSTKAWLLASLVAGVCDTESWQAVQESG